MACQGASRCVTFPLPLGEGEGEGHCLCTLPHARGMGSDLQGACVGRVLSQSLPAPSMLGTPPGRRIGRRAHKSSLPPWAPRPKWLARELRGASRSLSLWERVRVRVTVCALCPMHEEWVPICREHASVGSFRRACRRLRC